MGSRYIGDHVLAKCMGKNHPVTGACVIVSRAGYSRASDDAQRLIERDHFRKSPMRKGASRKSDFSCRITCYQCIFNVYHLLFIEAVCDET